jgi:hypothetical protein
MESMTVIKKFIRSEFHERSPEATIPMLDKPLLTVLSYFDDRISNLNLSQQFLFDKFRSFQEDMKYFERKVNTAIPLEEVSEKVTANSSISLCPLCGDEAFIRLGQPKVTCNNDYCRFSGPLKGTHEEAIKSWNVIVSKIMIDKTVEKL